MHLFLVANIVWTPLGPILHDPPTKHLFVVFDVHVSHVNEMQLRSQKICCWLLLRVLGFSVFLLSGCCQPPLSVILLWPSSSVVILMLKQKRVAARLDSSESICGSWPLNPTKPHVAMDHVAKHLQTLRMENCVQTCWASTLFFKWPWTKTPRLLAYMCLQGIGCTTPIRPSQPSLLPWTGSALAWRT